MPLIPRFVATVFIGLLLATSLAGCATRTVRHSLIKQRMIQADLVREVSWFSVEERGFEHPAIISTQRLTRILNAIEVETQAKGSGTIRQPAFHPETVPRTAEALAKALAEASPNEEVGIKIIRIEARLGVFNKKFLTSFLAYIEDDHLYLLLRRIDWPIKESDEMRGLPEPQRNRKAMDFRVVSGDPIYFAGLQDLEIDWQSDVFRSDFRLPGTTSGEKLRREILGTSPVPRDEVEANQGDGIDFNDISPEQLRALADLEEERRNGRITESAYQRARRQLLRKR
jgi:hypothetical protein